MGEVTHQKWLGHVGYAVLPDTEGVPDPTGWFDVGLPDLPWVVWIRTATIDGAPRIIGLILEPKVNETGEVEAGFSERDLIVSTEALRALPLAKVYDVVRRQREGDAMGVIDALERVERKPGEPWPDEHYRLVAEVYDRAANAGLPPTEAVKARWKVGRAMASKYVRGARERGYLAWPEKPGLAGTGRTSLRSQTDKEIER